jgi:hypothetical protein
MRMRRSEKKLQPRWHTSSALLEAERLRSEAVLELSGGRGNEELLYGNPTGNIDVMTKTNQKKFKTGLRQMGTSPQDHILSSRSDTAAVCWLSNGIA